MIYLLLCFVWILCGFIAMRTIKRVTLIVWRDEFPLQWADDQERKGMIREIHLIGILFGTFGIIGIAAALMIALTEGVRLRTAMWL